MGERGVRGEGTGVGGRERGGDWGVKFCEKGLCKVMCEMDMLEQGECLIRCDY